MTEFFGHLWIFAVLTFGIIILPGVDMALVLASSMAGGLRQGAAALSGVMAGAVGHVLMASAGLSLIVAIYPLAFNLLLIAGALYLAWIGWGLISGAEALTTVQRQAPSPLLPVFWRSVMTSLLNPKAYLFMLAVFPQFVRPAYGPLLGQALVAGLVIAINQFVVYGAVALGAGRLRLWLAKSPQQQIWLSRAIGCLLLATACWTAFEGFLAKP